MADPETTPLTASPAVSDVNQDDESRMLLGFLQYQRDSVLKIVEGLPEDAWQTPVVSSGWTVAGMLWHLGGVEHHWLQHVTTGVMEETPAAEEAGDEEEGTYDPEAAFTCDWPSADLIANYRDECRRSNEVLAPPRHRPVSGRGARPSGVPADQHNGGHGQQDGREDDEDAGLDPLERPEPAGGLVGHE